jgi:energy-coupling factor transport system ATP-binding protein
MALTLDAVGYTYAPGTSLELQALAGISLSVEPGELLLVLGSTGSGKSTLLRLCAGLLEPGEGAARLDDGPLTRSTARGAVGLVFQDAESQLFAETLAADVAFGPRNLGVNAEEVALRVREALLSVGLDPEAYGPRSPFALSGGEARRAAIAGVLAMRPRYLLLDEPTAGLDSRGRAAVREVVRGMRASAGVVVVSHSAEEFLGEADRVVVLAQGRQVFTGDARGLVSDPSPFEAAGLLAPDVLRFQMIARAEGHDCGVFTLDPELAAANALKAGGWS